MHRSKWEKALDEGKVWRAKEILRSYIKDIYDPDIYKAYGKILYDLQDYEEAGKYLFAIFAFFLLSAIVGFITIVGWIVRFFL